MTAVLSDTAPIRVTEPGIYEMTDVEYHGDPVPGGSLSSSGARRLLPPSCPALFRYEQDNPPAPKATFDFGHAAHQMVLGAGPEIVRVVADDWRTKAAREERAAAHAADQVPLLPADYDRVVGMADAIRRHPMASALLDPAHGSPEQNLFWEDDETGVWRRARLDWLPNPRRGRLIVADYKTTVSGDPDAVKRTVHKYGYNRQAAWYVDALVALGLAEDPAFVLILQDKTPPYLIAVAQPDFDAERDGREHNRRAIEVYRDCRAADRWPGYGNDEIQLVSLPPWASRHHDEEDV